MLRLNRCRRAGCWQSFNPLDSQSLLKTSSEMGILGVCARAWCVHAWRSTTLFRYTLNKNKLQTHVPYTCINEDKHVCNTYMPSINAYLNSSRSRVRGECLQASTGGMQLCTKEIKDTTTTKQTVCRACGLNQTS